MVIEADLHVHTKYSFDSLLEPRAVVKVALMRGLSAIAVTDHNTIRGGLAAIREAPSMENLIVIPGIEVKTDMGDLIGLYVQEEIKSRVFYEVVDEIKRQDGLVILPHPYRGHKGAVEDLIKCADMVEAMNGRCSRDINLKAFQLAINLGKPAIACSDAHFAFEIGRLKTRFYSSAGSPEELRKEILNCKRQLVGKESPFLVHWLTFAIEILKRMTGFYRG